ncbi:hypothetical protein OEZ85_003833 [Tetradesmus obliquus]|uniref:DUF7148 domain-containing protein n=1 Tax=Tetradesmus obliquus TaxID=3088 RepID=A0ABY8UHU0_TETOB|nr:hypothetical protein OEZ85_003833 [Tetradesmus obliquus]
MQSLRCSPSHKLCRSTARPSVQLRAAAQPRSRTVLCLAAVRTATEAHLQLATAKLPAAADVNRFAESMYQWAATMTQSGANFPFVLPIQVDKIQSPPGFQMSLLRRGKNGGFGSAGDIVGTVEDAPGVGKVLMIRFYEGPTAQDSRITPPPTDPEERLEVVLKSMPDVDTLMATMPRAIRAAVAVSTP